ncbi:MAG: cytidine deaminase [Clostridiaceae bacterium]|nr:cytidine deaminase [Clostridiaceae bacterium]
MSGTDRELISAAEKARESAYCPYSGFSVGAALLCADQSVVTGCNVENAAFISVCAEQNAVCKAISEGKREFRAIAVVGAPVAETSGQYCPPCGKCRQILAEFCEPDSFEVILYDSEDWVTFFTLGELLPESFIGRGDGE